MAADLRTYREKRNFTRTPEPQGEDRAAVGERLQFVVQKHHARRLHYDFRLEHDGVLKSWAVPKGPSLDPAERRLAVQTEDHPVEYAVFEGVIPRHEYGGGAVLVWDRGWWRPEGDATKALAKGKVDFELFGEKLRGRWTLVRMPPRGKEKDNWLLIKRRDRQARAAGSPELVDTRPESVLTGRDIDTVAADKDRVWHSKAGESQATVVAEVGRPDTIPGARRGPLPARLEPQRPQRVERVPDDAGWLHEPKLEGRRLLCRLDRGKAALRAADGSSSTTPFASIAEAAAALPCGRALLDGVAVVFDDRGVSSSDLLDNPGGGERPVVMVAFDLLHVDGWDLRAASTRSRKELLRLLLTDAPGDLRYGEHVEGHGRSFFKEACRLGLAGVVSKDANDGYRSGVADSWVVVDCRVK